jgi:hypothetical protein
MQRRIARFALAALVCVVIAVSGVTVGLVLASSPTPGSLEKAAAITEAPLSAQAFNDERKVKIAVETNTSPSLVSSAGGVITAVSCGTGSSFESTNSSFAVDGNPVLNLATDIPLWRDFKLGDKGADIEQVQAEFQRVGYSIPVDGVFGKSTLDAFRDALRQADHPNYLTVEFTRAAVQWIPAVKTPVESCKLELGHTLSAGSDIATLPTGVLSASIVSMPTDLIEGARTLDINGSQFEVNAEGRITGSEQLAVLAMLMEQQPSQDPSDQVGGSGVVAGAPDAAAAAPELSGTYSLKEVAEVASVPASAVTAISGSDGCIVADGKPQKVVMVASELGKTLVTLAGGIPKMVSIDPPKDIKC